MVKTRVIGVLVAKDGLVVQSINFNRYLPVGKPPIAVDYLNKWGIDEIVFLDISATSRGKRPDWGKIGEYSKYCHVPLAVGGGIACLEDIEKLIANGADKVVLNTAAVENGRLISLGAKSFGNQCIVVSIDALSLGEGRYEARIRAGKKSAGCSPVELARISADRGAGEIFLNSIDRDGSKQGYDMELIRQVVDAVTIPVIVCGGVGIPSHFYQAFDLRVSGVAAANFFHYTEHSAIVAKSFLKHAGKEIRLDSYASYEGVDFDHLERVKKPQDSALEKLRFEYIPEEVI